MKIFTIHTDNNKAYVILPDGNRIYIPMDENAVHIHKTFGVKENNINDIHYDICLYLNLPKDNTLVKSIIHILNSHK